MTAQGLSPEVLARRVPLSNMTIRRMLRRKANEKISEKYWPLFDQLLEGTTEAIDSHLLQTSTRFFSDFNLLAQDLEKTGQEHQDMNQLEDDVRSKMESKSVGSGLKTALNALLSTVSGSNSSLHSRAIAAGALLYFLNPVDLIPDALAGVGYLDDISVASVAISAITNKSNRKAKKKLLS